MTALKIIEMASLMLGLTGIEDSRIQGVAISALNRIYAELFYLTKNSEFTEISELTEPIDIDKRLFYDVMPYGVASLMAAALGDTENQNFYAQLYNLKRKKISSSQWQDTLPTV